jgi:uncharacterized surface anchored protein
MSINAFAAGLNWRRMNSRVIFLALALLIAATAWAQTTVGSGSIVGTVTDASNAVVEGAKVSITNAGTGQVIRLTTNASGSYGSGSLTPGNYRVLVAGPGYSSVDTPATVQIGNTATVNVRLQVGKESTVVEVQGSQL